MTAAAALAIVVVGPFFSLWLAGKLRPRKRSKLRSVAHSLQGPFRAGQVRMFVTVNGKTTELTKVRSLATDTNRSIRRVVRSMRRELDRPKPRAAPPGHGWVTGFAGDDHDHEGPTS